MKKLFKILMFILFTQHIVNAQDFKRDAYFAIDQRYFVIDILNSCNIPKDSFTRVDDIYEASLYETHYVPDSIINQYSYLFNKTYNLFGEYGTKYEFQFQDFKIIKRSVLEYIGYGMIRSDCKDNEQCIEEQIFKEGVTMLVIDMPSPKSAICFSTDVDCRLWTDFIGNQNLFENTDFFRQKQIEYEKIYKTIVFDSYHKKEYNSKTWTKAKINHLIYRFYTNHTDTLFCVEGSCNFEPGDPPEGDCFSLLYLLKNGKLLFLRDDYVPKIVFDINNDTFMYYSTHLSAKIYRFDNGNEIKKLPFQFELYGN